MSPALQSESLGAEDGRESLIRAFLKANGYGDLRRQPMAGDASTRSYERLHRSGGGSLILMNQPPRHETAPCPPEATPEERQALGFNAMYRLAAGRVDAFVAVAGHLNSLGLSTPRVLAFDAPAGLAVLEDLGDDLFAPLLADGADERLFYDAALDALLVIHRAPAPETLEADGVRWPLLTYDDLALRTAGDLLPEWLPQLTGAPALSTEALAEWEVFWAPVRARGEAQAEVFCHRAYHAENLVWLPDRAGPARVGMLDFQDAVRAHRAWDLSMLLPDARRDIAPELRAAILERYLQAEPQLDRAAFLRDFHALGALNIARIIGIFARLIIRDGRPRYRQFMPRMWAYLDECAAAPGLEGLQAWLSAHVTPAMRG